ncbi:COP9 signalosome complex subunit 7a-like isoform X3 [Salvelinus namaycush]|uniref:COP9 signalosome complex subunit 7a-like isoform X3 n=1 Tax=Salvelinus namaycush TaxID=8040 RepID=A0A8U0QV37_SALNM|nr:COP9 signalosome complex subunit 7a-like isoform X3 [Salvelinus namaycush]
MSSDVLLCCQTCADRGTERFGGQAINLSLLTNKLILSPAHSLSLSVALSLALSLSQMEVEQLLSLSGPALAQAISSLLETPGLYVFSDILELPNVREVTHTHIWRQARTHQCFSYSTSSPMEPTVTIKRGQPLSQS